MWINPNTGKGWSDEEEATFEKIMAVSRLSRIQSIQLWKRFRKDAAKATQVAERNYPKPSEAVLNRLENAREARFYRQKPNMGGVVDFPEESIAPGQCKTWVN